MSDSYNVEAGAHTNEGIINDEVELSSVSIEYSKGNQQILH